MMAPRHRISPFDHCCERCGKACGELECEREPSPCLSDEEIAQAHRSADQMLQAVRAPVRP